MQKSYDDLMMFLDKNPQWKNPAWLQRYLPYHYQLEGKRVLDLGCGTSLFAYALVKTAGAASYTGIDNNSEVFEPREDQWAKSILPYREALVESFPGRITYRQMSAEKIEYPSDSFDIVTAITVTEHLKDPERVFKEVRRVLVPGGYFLFTHHNYYSWDGHHQGPYDPKKSLCELTDLQKELLDWQHLFKDIDYRDYDQHENTYLNKIRWVTLRNIAAKIFFIVTWETEYSSEARGAARLTREIFESLKHTYLYEDVAVTELLCLCKKLTQEESKILKKIKMKRIW